MRSHSITHTTGRAGQGAVSRFHADVVLRTLFHDENDGSVHTVSHRAHVPESAVSVAMAIERRECKSTLHHDATTQVLMNYA